MNALSYSILNEPICISVPKNQAGILDLEHDVDKSENVEDFILTRRQYDYLQPIFTIMNSELGLMISEFEEELIPVEKVQAALNISKTYQEKHSLDPDSGITQLITALTYAFKIGMQVYLFF